MAYFWHKWCNVYALCMAPRPNLSPADHLTGMARPEFTTKSALVGRAVHIGAWKWPIFQVKNRKKISTLFFPEIFSAHKLFLWLQKIVLDLIYQIRQEYCDLTRADPLFFSLKGVHQKWPKIARKGRKWLFWPVWWARVIKIVANNVWEPKKSILGLFSPFLANFHFCLISPWFLEKKFREARNASFWPLESIWMTPPCSF